MIKTWIAKRVEGFSKKRCKDCFGGAENAIISII
jgi:hypothetical protein